MTNRLVDAKELSHYLGVPVTWCWSAAREGRIPSVRVGHYVRFDLQAVLAALEGRENKHHDEGEEGDGDEHLVGKGH